MKEADFDTSLPSSGQQALKGANLFSKKWTALLLLTLRHHGPLGFNDLLEAIPAISSKVLSETLSELTERGVVERRVLTESPLRVEYCRTPAGRELDTVFDELANWVDSHLQSEPPTVLLADADQRITEMYRQWLATEYTVVRAHTADQLRARFDRSVDVAVLDSSLLEPDVEDAISELIRGCRTVVTVRDRPSFRFLSINCDDIYRKPIVSHTAIEAIGTQCARLEESPIERERTAVANRLSFFESFYPPAQLEEHSPYQALKTRLVELESELTQRREQENTDEAGVELEYSESTN